jgi:CBS domain-containing protein
MLVKDIMTSPAVSVTETMRLDDVAHLMSEKNIGAVVVVSETGELRGIITESDITGVGRCIPFNLRLAPVILGARAATNAELAEIYERARTLPARQVMTRNVVTCAESDRVADIVQTMLDRDFNHLPVVREGKPVGVVARHDLLRLLAKPAASIG